MAVSDRMLVDFEAVAGNYNEDRTAWRFPSIITQSSRGGIMASWIEIRLFIESGNVAEDLMVTDGIDDNPNIDSDTFLVIQPAWHANKKIKPKKAGPIHAWMKTYVTYNDGLPRKALPTIITEGKNIGRANETNVFCQALRQAHNWCNKQKRKSNNRTESGDAFAMRIHPALARPTNDPSKSRFLDTFLELAKQGDIRVVKKHLRHKSDNGDYGIIDDTDHSTTLFTQPKIDGNRAVSYRDKTNDEIVLYTRDRKPYAHCAWIVRALEYLYDLISSEKRIILKGYILYFDGEIYQPDRDLQTINSYRSEKEENRSPGNHVKFHIFDCFYIKSATGVISDHMTSDRLAIIESLRTTVNESDIKNEIYAGLTFVHCVEIDRPKQSRINAAYQAYLDCGNEGMMLRLEGPYVPSPKSYRSQYLWKYKPRMDAEYEIVGYGEGKKGKAKGLLMITCVTNLGKEFTVTPKLTEKVRRKMYAEFGTTDRRGVSIFDKMWLGTKITVYYDDISEDGIPLRASTEMYQREEYTGD